MKPEDELDILRLEIRAIPTRHYNHAARALDAGQKLLNQRNRLITLAKELLMASGRNEEQSLAEIFRRIHRSSNDSLPPWSSADLEAAS